MHSSLKEPSSVVTIMTAVPSATAVTVPSASTVATAESLLSNVTFLFVASSGVIVTFSAPVLPGLNVSVSVTSTPLTLTGPTTLTLMLTDFVPALAVMVASPPDTPVTLPVSSIDAMDASLDVQTTISVVFAGLTVAVS